MDALNTDWLRWISIITMATVLVGGTYSIARHYKHVHNSISNSIAQTRSTYIMMGLLLTIGGSLYYSFMAFWLIPYYDISFLSYIVVAIAFVAQLGMAWIPASNSKKLINKAHFISGGVVAISMVVFSALVFLTSPWLSSSMRVILLIFVLASLAYLSVFTLSRKYRFRYFLIYESIFIATFALIYGLLALEII